MTKQEIIAAFEQAEKDWSKRKNQYDCLCWEFRDFYSCDDVYGYLLPLWKKYRTKEGAFHFNNREERLHAIRQVLNDLKNEQ
jgi:membrane-bound lytic murein transglycosylase MltF